MSDAFSNVGTRQHWSLFEQRLAATKILFEHASVFPALAGWKINEHYCFPFPQPSPFSILNVQVTTSIQAHALLSGAMFLHHSETDTCLQIACCLDCVNAHSLNHACRLPTDTIASVVN